MSVAEGAFALLLVVWTACSVLRFCNMYDLASPLQRFRRFDWFKLVPIGAFFGPEPPLLEYWILTRDVLADGHVTPWVEVPKLRPRAGWHAVFNPQKHIYKARSSLARRLILAREQLGQEAPGCPPTLVLSEQYLNVLRYVSALPRQTKPQGTQFAVVETNIVTRRPERSLLSRVHAV